MYRLIKELDDAERLPKIVLKFCENGSIFMLLYWPTKLQDLITSLTATLI